MSKANLSFWSVDALIIFLMQRDYKIKISSEYLSRLSAFIDSYVLFDKVCLPIRYRDEEIIKQLDTNNDIFEYIDPSELIHSDNLKDGITIDLNLNIDFNKISTDDFKWLSQHNPDIDYKSYLELKPRITINFDFYRVWQLGLVNEVSDKMDSVPVLPLSLNDLEALKGNRSRTTFVLEKYMELYKHVGETIKTISLYTNDPLVYTLENVPPFLALFVDKSTNNIHGIEVIKQLRKDYSDFREINARYFSDLKSKSSIRDKKDMIDQWNSEWEKLVAGSFRKPNLLKKKITLSEVYKGIVEPISSGVPYIIDQWVQQVESMNTYNRLKIFSDLYNEIDSIAGTRMKLINNFGVEDILEIN